MLKQELSITLTKRAVLYARSAFEDPSSIAEQLTICRQYAEDNDYVVVASLTDYGSGLSPELAELGHILQITNDFDVLIVTEIARLSRSLPKLAIIEDELQQAGVRIECVLTSYQSPREEDNNQC